MIDPRACQREYIKEGLHVLYSIGKDDPEEFWRKGIVTHIETNRTITFEKFGIKIRVLDGSIGYAKKILEEEDISVSDVKKLIERKEDLKVEFKETFKVATDTKTELKCLRDSCVKEIAAFMNTGGGFLLIGVDDAGVVKGLEPDYSFIETKRKNQTKADKLKQEIREYIKQKLMDESLEANYNIIIKQIDNNDICVVQVYPSSKPVFVDQTVNYVKCGETKQTTTTKQIFYIRTDSGVQELNPRKVIEYWNTKSNKIEK